MFAPVSPRHELEAAEVVKRELGEKHISLSHEIGSIGLLERENATILNGALVGVARDVADAMRRALTTHHLDPITFFAQNDGTLMASTTPCGIRCSRSAAAGPTASAVRRS